MELQKRHNQLRSLREEIATLCIVKCRMSHERVVRDGESGLPVICRFPEGSYQRVGLCTAEIRAKRLGCSHTSARIKLDDAIKKLATSYRGNNAASLLFSSELVWLNNAIHLLDHRKGEAEKSLARILDEAHRAGAQGDKGQNMRESENEIYEMEQLHDEYVERIGELRDRIVIEIDKLLAE
jgi:hypothetical protein